jgi:hypothetical protein
MTGLGPSFCQKKVSMKKILTPIKVIRAKCVDCMNHQTKEIRLCPMTNCPLWPYRMGKRPKKDGAEHLEDGPDCKKGIKRTD